MRVIIIGFQRSLDGKPQTLRIYMLTGDFKSCGEINTLIGVGMKSSFNKRSVGAETGFMEGF